MKNGITRQIQTKGSIDIDGPIECNEKRNVHTWRVEDEWGDPTPGQDCLCGKEKYPNDNEEKKA